MWEKLQVKLIPHHAIENPAGERPSGVCNGYEKASSLRKLFAMHRREALHILHVGKVWSWHQLNFILWNLPGRGNVSVLCTGEEIWWQLHLLRYRKPTAQEWFDKRKVL